MPPLWNFGTTPLVTVAFPWDDPKSTDVISVCRGRGRNKKGLPPKGMGGGKDWPYLNTFQTAGCWSEGEFSNQYRATKQWGRFSGVFTFPFRVWRRYQIMEIVCLVGSIWGSECLSDCWSCLMGMIISRPINLWVPFLFMGLV